MMDHDEEDNSDVDDAKDIEDLFPFLPGEDALINKLEKTIRLKLASLAPVDIRKLATFLYALERLPYATRGVSIDLAITQRIGRELSYVSVEISSDAFRLSTGGSVYTPDVGSDSYSETTFEVETGGYREGATEDFEAWLDAFRAMAGEYSIEDSSGDDIDLIEEVEPDGWDRLAAYRESQGGNEFGY